MWQCLHTDGYERPSCILCGVVRRKDEGVEGKFLKGTLKPCLSQNDVIATPFKVLLLTSIEFEFDQGRILWLRTEKSMDRLSQHFIIPDTCYLSQTRHRVMFLF
ncbi:MAG: hypothetical protein SV375_15365 [Thermodesulfobacteriota bacterium]|nr:hypothetical protein [Thermodesulfobacteriota bacterium]